MDISIAQHHASCVSLFHALAVSLGLQAVAQEDKTTTAEERQFEDAFDKFKLWAGNSGAMHTDMQHNESLYYTLREVSFHRTPVLQLLQDLKAVLEATLALTNNEHSTLEEDGITRSNNFTTDPPGLKEHDPEEEESPWEISSDSEDDESPVLERRTATSTGTHRTIPSTHSTSVSGQLALLESVGYIVTCLRKLPQRRPAHLDAKLQPSEEQSLDIMHVRDKFPTIDDGVAKRLGRLISRRRRSIQSLKIHEEYTPQGPGAKDIKKRPSIPVSSGWRSWSKFRSTTRNSREPIADLREVEDQDSLYLSESTSSMASERTTRAARLKIPQRPIGDDGKYLKTFICPCCSTIQSIAWEREWRRHVLDDLQPYVCTYPECAICEYAFRGRKEWFAHEQSHRPEWHCNDESHKAHDEQSKFFKHLDIVHKFQVSETHRPILARNFQRPSRLLSGRCNLCGEHSTKLKSHLSRHLEELFLFAIPKTDGGTASATKKPQINLVLRSGPSNIESIDTGTGYITPGLKISESSAGLGSAWRPSIPKTEEIPTPRYEASYDLQPKKMYGVIAWYCSECCDGPYEGWQVACQTCQHSKCTSCTSVPRSIQEKDGKIDWYCSECHNGPYGSLQSSCQECQHARCSSCPRRIRADIVSGSVPRYEQPTASPNSRGEEPGPTEKFSSEVPVHHLGTPKTAQPPGPSSIVSSSNFKEGSVSYCWHCCACHYGGNSYKLDQGCANCANHWRCQYCSVEKTVH